MEGLQQKLSNLLNFFEEIIILPGLTPELFF